MSPATCVTGIGSNNDSPGCIACAAAIVSASTRSDWCVCTTPLGSDGGARRPEDQRGIVDAYGDGRRIASRFELDLWATERRPRRRRSRCCAPCSRSRCPRNACGTAMTRAPVCSRMYPTSCARKRRCDRARGRAAHPDAPAKRDRLLPVRQLPARRRCRAARRATTARLRTVPTRRGCRRRASGRITVDDRDLVRIGGRESVEQCLVGPDAVRAPTRPHLGGRGIARVTARRKPVRAWAPARSACAPRYRPRPDPSARSCRGSGRAASRRRPR